MGLFLAMLRSTKDFFSKSLLHVLLMFWLTENPFTLCCECLGAPVHLSNFHLTLHIREFAPSPVPSSIPSFVFALGPWTASFYLESSRKSHPCALKQCSLASGLLGSWLPPSLLALAKSYLFHASSMTMDLGNRNKVSSCPGSSYFVLLLVFGSSGELYSTPISMPIHSVSAGTTVPLSTPQKERQSLSP